MFENQVKAEHIYGGNLHMIQTDKAAGKFKIALNIYVDFIIMPASEDIVLQKTPVTIRIFAKKDNAQVAEIALPFETLFDLVYDNETCAKLRNLKTREYRYAKEITLNLDNYTDDGGYYMAWAKCCRNTGVNNIANAGKAGMTLYLEFPALKKNGNAVQYSSPIFTPPNGDYICNKKPFKFDLGAIDKDSLNELRYSIVTPYGSHNTLQSANALAKPAPYPLTQWIAGYSANVSIKGSKPLSIDAKTGLVSLTAGEVGLFVFSIQCDQYRNGQKIGSVRHDFQLPVVDCSNNTPPAGKITYKSLPVTEVSICPGETVNLDVSATGGSFNFQWQRDGDNIVGANQPTLQVKDFGDYTVVKSYKAVCANDTVSQIVKVKEAVLLKLIPSPKELCKGDSISIEVNPLKSGVTFSWIKDNVILSNKAKLYAKQTGTYYIEGKVAGSTCSTKDSVKVTLKPSPKITLEYRNYIVPLGESRTFKAESDNSLTTFKWSPNQWMDNAFIKTPTISPQNDIVYKLLAETPNMCPVKDSIEVKILKKILIPTAFTPNNDSVNDFWEIANIKYFPDAEIYVFNRWGELVFFSKGKDVAWDGKYKDSIVPSGEYIFEIRGASNFKDYKYTGVINVLY
jgi:gliding motility-associated-like protein